MSIDEFLRKYVEGYLFHDLENMADITVPSGEDGAASYPMVMTTLSGMELLWALVFWEPFCEAHDASHFAAYWRYFLSRGRAKTYPADESIILVIREMVRNGLAHSALTKPGIVITKGDSYDRHFKIDPARQALIIDCVRLYRDFHGSYDQWVRPIVQGASSSYRGRKFTMETMQKRLDEIESVVRAKATKLYANPALSKLLLSSSPTAQSTTGSGSYVSIEGRFTGLDSDRSRAH